MDIIEGDKAFREISPLGGVKVAAAPVWRGLWSHRDRGCPNRRGNGIQLFQIKMCRREAGETQETAGKNRENPRN